MHQPERYSAGNSLQKRDAKFVLDNYLRLIKWKTNPSILDIGCGNGEVTLDILLPRLPSDFSELIALDVSEAMIKSAKLNCSDKRIDFKTFNIASKSIPNDLKEKVHHIFSFYCLHWIQEQRQALQNMFNMLKPGGDMLLMFLSSNPIYDIYESMAKNNKWSPYMENWKTYVSPYHTSENPEKDCENLLNDVGFISHLCRVEEKSFTFANLDILKKSVLAVSPFISKIPKTEHEAYIEDYIQETRKLNCIVIKKCSNNNEESVTVPYKLFIIFASRLF